MKFFILLYFLLTSCSSERQQCIDRVSNIIVKKVYHQYKLFSGGIGSTGPYEIKNLDFYFISNEVADLNQARKIIIDVSKIIVCISKQDMQLITMMNEGKFTEENVFVSIAFPSRFFTANEYLIDYVIFSGIDISYNKMNHEIGRYVEVFRESFDEAYLKCQNKIN